MFFSGYVGKFLVYRIYSNSHHPTGGVVFSPDFWTLNSTMRVPSIIGVHGSPRHFFICKGWAPGNFSNVQGCAVWERKTFWKLKSKHGKLKIKQLEKTKTPFFGKSWLVFGGCKSKGPFHPRHNFCKLWRKWHATLSAASAGIPCRAASKSATARS